MQLVARQCRKPLAMLSEALVGAVCLSSPSLSLIPGSGPFEVFPEPALFFPTLFFMPSPASRLPCAPPLMFHTNATSALEPSLTAALLYSFPPLNS